MAKLAYFLLCENFIFDKDNKSSIVNIFDVINATSLPALAGAFTLAVGIKNIKNSDASSDGIVNFAIEVVDEKDTKLVRAEGEDPVTSFPANIVSAINLGGKIAFNNEGDYEARLFMNEKVIATTSFEVKLKKEEE